ncbi:MAG: hypothetical protein AAFW00_27470 [Bacteroidota bacterium]
MTPSHQRQPLFLLLILLLSTSSLFAQSDPVCQEITAWFQEERFIIADQNEDALLARTEMQVFPQEFVYFLAGRHFQIADINKDGFLSFNELHAKRKSENIFRYQLERRQIREMAQQHPYLAQADERYLKKYPILVKTLFTNLLWLSENAPIAEKIYKDRRWISSNSEAILALHRNLRWMAANPSEASQLYNNRYATSQLPELIGWRAEHKAFIRQHPKLDRFYEASFIPGGF